MPQWICPGRSTLACSSSLACSSPPPPPPGGGGGGGGACRLKHTLLAGEGLAQHDTQREWQDVKIRSHLLREKQNTCGGATPCWQPQILQTTAIAHFKGMSQSATRDHLEINFQVACPAGCHQALYRYRCSLAADFLDLSKQWWDAPLKRCPPCPCHVDATACFCSLCCSAPYMNCIHTISPRCHDEFHSD